MKHHSLAATMVIGFVGSGMLISLLITGWLLWQGKPAGDMNLTTVSCVTGLVGLLGRTENASQGQRRADVIPPIAPIDVAIKQPEGEPVPVVETPADGKPGGGD